MHSIKKDIGFIEDRIYRHLDVAITYM